MCIRLTLAVAVVLGATAVLTACDDSEKATGDWSGTIRDASLRELAPKTGFINDAKTFEKTWTAWRPDEKLPDIDFDKQFVLVGTVIGPNRVIMKPELNETGDLKFRAAGTRIGGPGFGYRLMVVDRKGVKSVNGNDIDSKAEESIEVTVVGKLKTGIVAIGGETTGATITAKGISWELDFGDSEQLRQRAKSLSGQQILVEGSLDRRRGIEIKERWIVTVTKLQGPE